MILDSLDAEEWADALGAVLFGLTCFLLGVSYAIYRALSWADRMHEWAGAVIGHAPPLPVVESEVCNQESNEVA